MELIQFNRRDPKQPIWVNPYAIESVTPVSGPGRENVVGSVIHTTGGHVIHVDELPEVIVQWLESL